MSSAYKFVIQSIVDDWAVDHVKDVENVLRGVLCTVRWWTRLGFSSTLSSQSNRQVKETRDGQSRPLVRIVRTSPIWARARNETLAPEGFRGLSLKGCRSDLSL